MLAWGYDEALRISPPSSQPCFLLVLQVYDTNLVETDSNFGEFHGPTVWQTRISLKGVAQRAAEIIFICQVPDEADSLPFFSTSAFFLPSLLLDIPRGEASCARM